MHFLKRFLPLIVFAFIISCKSKADKDVTFTIVQLNDVYEISPIQGNKYGGMARVETVHKELLKENPNTMLVLAGDFLNPSLLGTIKVNGERVRGKQMVEVMNAMNFELVAFGNHEFDLSYEHLQNRLNESKFEWICSNVYHNVNGENESFVKVVDGKTKHINQTFIKEFTVGSETIKVGFISVCIPSNPRSYVTYTDMFEEAKRTYEELKDKTDFVLGLTHVKVEDDIKIAEMLPNIPLIMGGHEHTNKYEKAGNSIISKADANAKTVYIHRFKYNTTTKKIDFNSELKTIDESIPADKEVGEVVSKWENILNTQIKEVIPNPNEIVFTTETPLDARDTQIRSVQTNMGEIVAAAMSKAYDDSVDCAFVNGGSIRIDDELLGDISAVDIFRVLPYGGPVLKVSLKGDLLEEVLNFGEKAAGTGAYLQMYNITKSNNQWLVQNKIIDKKKTYTIATSDYLLKGFDIPFLKPSNPKVVDVYTPTQEEEASDVRKSVITYLKSK
ncbi:2',3'-cyclic-nucleotide 2'-phosphodiesterase (5'-nucleotidase family) [Tenacibaculum skagerrakense]|uniref:2',3'-cyclic-nucleotide 2'-phosphodiesterase (5'-nucleotidase family) n=1 Tax=Tenacibaculum skagerrakense TaxID=186571 RepID=A0A4R2NTS2_9FLAO|nr:bifunctional metallophosphatase/5'-nucleotidase [Tenacibaculum skagerrakense]TCP24795.1 2',3'-cyclic-nucleotide 2'-phosphodiesterase (5'-nucleotidase family) [Tenacibaculum skagerrakense]